MESITIGQILDILKYIVVIAGTIGSLYALLMKGIEKLLKPINNELRNEKMKRLKSELTTFMYLAENGSLSQEQKILAHEDYDEYIENKGNSYIHDKFEKLNKEGKI